MSITSNVNPLLTGLIAGTRLVSTNCPLILRFSSPAGAGERIWIVGDTLTFKATANTTGGALTAIECEAAPGGGPPPHIHDNEDEAFYVLEGEFEILLGDELVQAGPGDFAFVPRGTVHRFANIGDARGRSVLLRGYSSGSRNGSLMKAPNPDSRRSRASAGSPPRAA